MINAKMLGMLIAAFVAGSFLSSPELRAYASTIANDVICNGCVGTSDIAGNAVTAAKIKDGEVKALEIATDAVGAAELQGVTKLLFGECTITQTTPVGVNGTLVKSCVISGVDADDRAIVTPNDASNSTGERCLRLISAEATSGSVALVYVNECNAPAMLGTASIGVIVYDK